MTDAKKDDLTSGLPRVSVEEDGTLIELEFKNDSGKKQVLRFSPDRFEQLIGRAAQTVADARNRTSATSDPPVVHVVEVAGVELTVAADGSRVILTFESPTGLPFHFSVAPEQIEELLPFLSSAANNAKQLASSTRH